MCRHERLPLPRPAAALPGKPAVAHAVTWHTPALRLSLLWTAVFLLTPCGPCTPRCGVAHGAEEAPTPKVPAAGEEKPREDTRAAPRNAKATEGPALSEEWRREMEELQRETQENAPKERHKRETWDWTDSLKLVLLALLLAGGAWVVFRVRRGLGKGTSSDDVQVLSRKVVAPKNSLLVVRVRGRDYLLGEGPGGISLLTMLPQPVEQPSNASPPPAAGGGSEGSKSAPAPTAQST